MGKHKELRRWTHAGRWGDGASGFVWPVKEGWRGGSLSFNPSARVCVRNRGFLQVKYLEGKLNFGIVAYNLDWRGRQVVSNPASFKAGASACGVGSSEGTSEMSGTSGCLGRTWELGGGGSTSGLRLQRQYCFCLLRCMEVPQSTALPCLQSLVLLFLLSRELKIHDC